MSERRDFERTFDHEVYGQEYYEGGARTSGYDSYPNVRSMIREQFTLIDMVMASRVSRRVHLDIACAYGFAAKLMQERGWEVAGWDVSEFAIEQARTTHGFSIPFVVADATEGRQWQKLPEKGIGLVTSVEFFEHIDSAQVPPTLEHMQRACEWGFFVVNASTSPLMEEETTEDAMGDHGHLNHHDLTWWIKNLSAVGVIDYEAMQQFGRMAYAKYAELRWHSRTIVVRFH